jgi:hypothetical protein
VERLGGLTLLLVSAIAAAAEPSMVQSAARFVPGVRWRAGSVLTADFSCSGRRQHAILGTNAKDIVIAVFVNGESRRPEVLRYSAAVRVARWAKLTLETLDYDPLEELGYSLPGFQRSRTCKGLNLGDGETDSAHIYWNRDDHQFNEWSR